MSNAKNIPLRVRVDLSHKDLEMLVSICEYVEFDDPVIYKGKMASIGRVKKAAKELLKESSDLTGGMQKRLDALAMKNPPGDKALLDLHHMIKKKSVDHKRGYLKGLQDVLVAHAKGDAKEIKRLSNFLNLITQAFGN